MTRKQRGRRTWKKWRRLISEQSASGQTVSAFCRDRGLHRQSFFAWRKRLNPAETKRFVEVTVTKPLAQPVRDSAAIEVRLMNGRSLMVAPGFDVNHLRTLVAALEAEA